MAEIAPRAAMADDVPIRDAARRILHTFPPVRAVTRCDETSISFEQ
ncbi:MAG TPA: hypothetical protein VHH12_03105 [Mycobacterium sp.]|nr:hypothetical protein [Mycobacterium sp.]